jgi:hypothetical protein
MGTNDVKVGDHVKITMDENNPRAGQYHGKEADVEGEIETSPRVLKLYVYELEDTIYVKDSEVKPI